MAFSFTLARLVWEVFAVRLPLSDLLSTVIESRYSVKLPVLEISGKKLLRLSQETDLFNVNILKLIPKLVVFLYKY